LKMISLLKALIKAWRSLKRVIDQFKTIPQSQTSYLAAFEKGRPFPMAARKRATEPERGPPYSPAPCLVSGAKDLGQPPLPPTQHRYWPNCEVARYVIEPKNACGHLHYFRSPLIPLWELDRPEWGHRPLLQLRDHQPCDCKI
jgi:hypothetical protein